MAPKKPKSSHKRRSAWWVHWRLIEILVVEAFPAGSLYYGSRYNRWDKRIKAAHVEDERDLKSRLEEHEKKAAESEAAAESLDETVDWLSDLHAETCDLTSRMYAALVVSMWADVEHFLKSVLGACRVATGHRKTELEKAKALCKEFADGKVTAHARRACLNALARIEAGIPREFSDLGRLLNEEIQVAIGGCKSFHVVNAIRVLSNCYKHSDGHYEPEGEKTHADTAYAQLRKWGVLNEREDIDYSKLPVQELVAACNTFCNELLNKVEAKLEAIRPEGAGDGG
jgi:hypothetical protein